MLSGQLWSINMPLTKHLAFLNFDIQYDRIKQRPMMKLLACLFAALVLSNCGGTGQDNGKAAPESQVFSGLAIDGYLARSLVFIDYDNNKTRDPWEPYAFTDDDGYFSFNRKTNTDYCAGNAPDNQQIFCLRTNRRLGETIIRIDGGYDVMTGEPFYGQMSRRIATNAFTSNKTIIISPITSLLTEVNSETTRNNILVAMGLRESDLDEDYLDPAPGIKHHVLGKAIQLHKTITLISHAVGESYNELGSQVGAMNDASAAVYKQLALQLANGHHSLDSITANTDLIAHIMAETELEVLDYYDRWEIPLPYQHRTAMEPSTIAERATDLSRLINVLMDHQVVNNDLSKLTGAIKLIEAMAIKAGDTSSSTALRSSVNFILAEQNQTLLSDLLTVLAEANSDLVSVARLDLSTSGLDSPDSVLAAAQLPANTAAFRDLPGQQLRVADMDLGSPPNRLRDAEVEIYFHGKASDTHGSFTACVKYIKDANIDGKLGDANTRGERVKGYWSLLGANQNGGASYSLLLTIDFLGSSHQAILKPAGQATLNSEVMQSVRFDYGNELRTWYTQNGLEPARDLPSTANDCANRLPSRIGI